ncbi:MAG TPA: HIT domain-containing protein [Candidatus Saccharimonadales bacterium]|nr:HIT domain-containing protein [Candidatus Saccharimonadales bacterium]
MEDSIFTKIIKGDIPAHKIYEDEKTIAFLTIQPVREGHTLVVPKIQVDQYIDLPDEDYDALWRTVKKIAARIREVTGKERVGVVIKGIDVPHAHVHLIPFNKGESLKADGAPAIVSSDILAPIAEKLRTT